MIAALIRGCRLMLLASVASMSVAGTASGQVPRREPTAQPSLAEVAAHVPIGEVVYVTDTTGRTIKGKLAVLTDDTVQVQVRDRLRSFAAADVSRIQWPQPDSPLTGVLLGAAVGAIPGVYWLAVDPNECRGMCPGEYALIAVGAVLGGVIDRAIVNRVTVYVAGAPSHRERRMRIGPLVAHGRTSVQVAVIF
jgi:hypothetical protein